MNWAWGVDLQPTKKLILMAIADHADDQGTCFPGQERLADKCCVSRRTVIRAVHDFEEKGILRIIQRPGDGEGRKSNIYKLNLEYKCTPTDSPAHAQTQRQSDNMSHRGQSDTGDRQSDTGDRQSDTGVTLTTSNNHQIEPSVLLRIPTFDEFWAVYPKKKSKGAAEKAWNKLTDEQKILVMQVLPIAKQQHDWIKQNGKYVPYPASWLNAKGFEDEYDTPEDDDDMFWMTGEQDSDVIDGKFTVESDHAA
jgi:hypothetical protein